MLQKIRDRTSGIVAGFIIAIIAVPFAFWGIESFNTGGGDPVVAKVGDQKIHESQFRRAYEQRYQQLQQLLGENFRADMFDQARFRRSVLDDMTQESMLRQYAQDAGYQANDAILFEYISGIPAFQRDGKFSSEAYREALARNGFPVERFEQQERDRIAIDQLREGVTGTSFVTEAEARAAYRVANQQRFLAYAVFDHAKYLPQITVADDEVKARYEKDKARHLAPERVKLQYVELALDTLAPAAEPGTEVLKVIYDAERESRFTTQEERKASHILINFGADKDAAKKKAEDLAAKLKGGAAFAELARGNSDDPGSKTQGGDLGWVKRGSMVQKFEEVLFAQKVAEVSAPVETEFGWHLIRADEIRPVITRSFEDADVQRELLEVYRGREQARRFKELSEQIEQLAFEKSGSLEEVARELKLEVQTTDWFTRAGGAGIAANEAVKTAAFSTEVIKDNENSKPIALEENRLVVVRKGEYEPARQRALEEVADAIRDGLRGEQARAKAQADAAEVLAAAKAGQPLEALAVARGAELKSVGLVRRDHATEDRAIVQALFRMPRPAAGASGLAEVRLGSGSVAVVALSAVQDAAWPPQNEQEIVRQRQQLRDATAGAEFAGYRAAIEQGVKVEVVRAPEAEAPVAPEEE